MKKFRDIFSPDLNRKWGIRIRGSPVKSFRLNNYRITRASDLILVFPEFLYVFEVNVSISRSFPKLPVLGDLENQGQLPVSGVLYGTVDSV